MKSRTKTTKTYRDRERPQPMGLRDVLYLTIKTASSNLLQIDLLAFLFVLPTTLFRTYLSQPLISKKIGESTAYLSMVISWIDFIFYVAFFIWIVFITEKALKRQKFTFQDTYKFIATRILYVFWVNFICFLLITISTIFLVLPGIIITGYISFAATISALRGKNGLTAIKSSYKLVKGRWWRVNRILIIVGTFVWLINLTITLITNKVPDIWILHVMIPNLLVYINNSIPIIVTAVIFLNLESIKSWQKPRYSKQKTFHRPTYLGKSKTWIKNSVSPI